jgi:hypothetical protein
MARTPPVRPEEADIPTFLEVANKIAERNDELRILVAAAREPPDDPSIFGESHYSDSNLLAQYQREQNDTAAVGHALQVLAAKCSFRLPAALSARLTPGVVFTTTAGAIAAINMDTVAVNLEGALSRFGATESAAARAGTSIARGAKSPAVRAALFGILAASGILLVTESEDPDDPHKAMAQSFLSCDTWKRTTANGPGSLSPWYIQHRILLAIVAFVAALLSYAFGRRRGWLK